MNLSMFGRRNSKLVLIVLFTLFTIMENNITDNKQIAFQMYNIGRICIQACAMAYHTHLNETFTTKNRLRVHAYAFSLGKFTAAIAPFVLEYLTEDSFYVMTICNLLLFVLYWFQKETLNKALIDK